MKWLSHREPVNELALPDPLKDHAKPGRLIRLDIARGLALLAMAIYHFGWDLEFFGYLTAGTTAHGGWKIFARCIAASFLFLVGFSLVLAHGKHIRWRAFAIRFVQISAAAAAISAITYYFTPESFIFFGILHQIALASLLGLLFLRVPPLLTVLVAIFVVAAPLYLRSPIFDAKYLAFLGLSTVDPRSNDYVPIFPWFAAVLSGIAAARIAQRLKILDILRGGMNPQWLQNILTFCGRHSLAFYLIHQPVLIGVVFLASLIIPSNAHRQAFVQSCEISCSQQTSGAICQKFCSCMIDEIDAEKLGSQIYSGSTTEKDQEKLNTLANICTAKILP